MKVMIVDDETLALNRLKRLLNEHHIEDITPFTSSLDALEQAKKELFDAVFLDISMPKLNGLELASQIVQLHPQTFVVFQTAYEQYALEAFESGGMAYLLKPIDSNSVLKALQKIRNYKTQSSTKPIKKILGKYGDTIYLVNVEDIYYIKADLDEAIIKIQDKEIYVKRKIGELETLLQHENFFRVHRSYIVNVNKIKSMNSIEQSKFEIGFEGISQIITSSKEGAKEFREYLQRQSL